MHCPIDLTACHLYYRMLIPKEPWKEAQEVINIDFL